MPSNSSHAICSALSMIVAACIAAAAHADQVGGPRFRALPNEECIDLVLQLKEELATQNQRYWYARVPPYVGFRRGERLMAGGNGTCYLGFPNAQSDIAHASIDGKVVQLVPQVSAAPDGSNTYKSKDGSVTVDVKVTGQETTCVPNEDKCCGDYTYATISVSRGGRSTSVKAVRYGGS
jgi:hypothetical protein